MSKKVPHAVSRELRMNIVGLLSIVPRNVKVVEGEPNSKHREAAEESIDGQGMFAAGETDIDTMEGNQRLSCSVSDVGSGCT